MTEHAFTTTIEVGGKTATGFRVPPEVVTALGSGKRPKVHVTIGSHTYRTTVSAYGDLFMIPLSAENRTPAGVAAGDIVEVTLRLDTEPRTVEVPADLRAALEAAPGAWERFEAQSFTNRKEAARSVESAKAQETRERRIRKVVDSLAG